MRLFLILLLDAHSSQARQMIRTSHLTSSSFERQARYCLNISDRCLRYHESFIFLALNMLQRRQAHLQTHFAVRRSNFDSDDRNLTNVSPDVLQRLASRLEQECKLSNLDMDEWNALKLLHQVNTMSTHIPGSQASKMFVRNEIRNYYGYFGLPHIFFTFNPNPAYSPIFQIMYGGYFIDLSERLPRTPIHRHLLNSEVEVQDWRFPAPLPSINDNRASRSGEFSFNSCPKDQSDARYGIKCLSGPYRVKLGLNLCQVLTAVHAP